MAFGIMLYWKLNSSKNASQQSVHLTLGILRTSQAVFYALAFFWLDGFAVPAPAQVTQTVGQPSCMAGLSQQIFRRRLQIRKGKNQFQSQILKFKVKSDKFKTKFQSSKARAIKSEPSSKVQKQER